MSPTLQRDGAEKKGKNYLERNSENVLLKAGITVFNSKEITTETLFPPCKLCRLTCSGHQVPNSKFKQNALN